MRPSTATAPLSRRRPLAKTRRTRLPHRQRTLLWLLAHAPAPPTEEQLRDWLYLVGRETDVRKAITSLYDFVASPSGLVSFTIENDLSTLKAKGCVAPDMTATAMGRTIAADVPTDVVPALQNILATYGHLPPDALASHIRIHHPETIPATHPRTSAPSDPKIFTVGYRGRTPESLLQLLLDHGVTQLIDVRDNPFSPKFGLKKVQLQAFCPRVGVNYVHLPKYGISHERRQAAQTPYERRVMFGEYREGLRAQGEAHLDELRDLLVQSRSALMCAEECAEDCHRAPLADELARYARMEVVHV